MAAKRKYFKSKKAALTAQAEARLRGHNWGCFKMPKGSRHAGEYAVCSEVEYLNTY